MKKKILNTDDNDAMNATADVRNAGIGADYKDLGDNSNREATEETNEDAEDNNEPLKDEQPHTGEMALPEEANEDELA